MTKNKVYIYSIIDWGDNNVKMKKSTFCLFFLLGIIQLYSQTNIAIQSFETSGDTWTPLNFSTNPCNINNDIWDYVNRLPGISPNDGLQFWGIRDLDGNCGGNGFESIIFPNVDISSFTNVNFSFDYNAINFDNNEDLKYELFFDDVSQGEVIVVNGVGGGSDNTNGWLTETVSIPNSVNNVRVILSAQCNSNNERAGFDNVILVDATGTGLANDNCLNAQVLIVGSSNIENVITGTNAGASNSGELPNPTCGNYSGNDVWYTAQVPASGILTVETLSAGSGIDTAMAIYTGSCGNLTELDCNDDINWPSNPYSQIQLSGLTNTTIYIRVWAYNNASTGDFNIVAYSTIPPSNNDCVSAQNLIVGSANTENIVTGTNEGATDSGVALPDNCDQYLGGDVWYTAQVPASGIINIETSNAGGISDTGIAVYTGSCGSLTQIDCDADSGPGFFSTLNLTGLANTTIYIRVWEYQNNNFGPFNIVAYSPTCPFSTTWNGNNWNNGFPNSFTSAVINGDYDASIDGDFDSCNCTINTGSIVNVRGNNYISVENDLVVNGTLEVRHEGSLIMVEDNGTIGSTGAINIHKTTSSFNQFDYIYWSSPTENETISSALASSEPDRIYQWNNINGWFAAGGSTIMDQGVGFIAMGPTTGTFPQTQSVIFDGIPNNGNIETPIAKNPDPLYTYLDWNLIGNPYPSAIDATLLLDDPLNSTIVNGSIYLWSHNTELSEDNLGSEKYNYSSSDYASFTSGTGGVAAISGGPIPNGFIASGQGFFIQAASNGNITFNNSMRATNNNDQFFKSADPEAEKDRIWLNLFNDKGAYSQILIGFLDGATVGIDRSYDGPKFGGGYISFYSIIDEQNFVIQGRSSIKEEDKIKLGLYSYIEQNDDLKISIDKTEGVLSEYNIYLTDKLLNKVHDLRIEDYTFIPQEQGVFNDRFELTLTKSFTLNIDENELANENLILINKENQIDIKTSNGTNISRLKIYNILGKAITNLKPNSDSLQFDTINLPKGTVLIINAILENKATINKKFIVY